jgi:Tol biopolymer transport system component
MGWDRPNAGSATGSSRPIVNRMTRFRRLRHLGPAFAAAGALALPLAAVGAQNAVKPVGTIAFTANPTGLGPGDVYVVRADGSRLRQLTNTPTAEEQPTWAPDGKSIAYVRVVGSGALYRLFLNGKKQRLLYKETSATMTIVRDPVWSPNGRRIAFASQRSGTPSIWTISLDGTLTQVTREFSSQPTWSPNSRRLAYAGLGRPGHETIFVARLDGLGRRDVSHAPVSDSDPVWSPNGKWIALRSLNKDWKAHEADSLEVVNPAGTVRKRVLSGAGHIAPLAWSPASDAILVMRNPVTGPDQTAQLFIVPLAGGRPRPVPGTRGVLGGASWHR